VEVATVNAFPNPASEHFFVELQLKSPTMLNMTMMDMRGTAVYAAKFDTLPQGNFVEKINTGSLAPGHYLLNIQTESGSTFQKIVID
jgi:hypothetical protein